MYDPVVAHWLGLRLQVLMSLWDLWSWSWDSVPIQNFERFVELQGLDIPEALFDHRALPTPS